MYIHTHTHWICYELFEFLMVQIEPRKGVMESTLPEVPSLAQSGPSRVQRKSGKGCSCRTGVSKATQKRSHAPFHSFIHSSIKTYVNWNNNHREALKANETYLGTAEYRNGPLCRSEWCAYERERQGKILLYILSLFLLLVCRCAVCVSMDTHVPRTCVKGRRQYTEAGSPSLCSWGRISLVASLVTLHTLG